MMQKYIYRVLFLGLISFAAASGKAQSFGGKIFVPSDLPKASMTAVEDLALWLKKVDNNTYTIENGTGKNTGITLQWAKTSNLPVRDKGRILEDGQSFYLEVKGRNTATITANGPNAFNNGIYTFLQELGYKFYMPGDIWTILPSSLPLKQIDRRYTPEFRNRSYAGSGGLRPIPGIDPTNSFKTDYDNWDRRNRFSVDYEVKSHAGQAFYTANKKVLDQNPNYFCKRQVDVYGRIDISKPVVVDMFVNWAVQQANTTYPYPVIGVDPSDGSGGNDDCLPGNMAGIKTWSDKYFWLANKVAEKLPANNSAQVQLYAYAAHADVPSFPVHEKVVPVIIPYAFQRVTTPEDFVARWHKKLNGREMGIYDYWNITQWSEGIPQFNIYSIPEKLRFWKRMNITGIYLESTNAKGPMGHAYWLASQMFWNTNLNFDSLYTSFLSTSFGPAAADVRKMYDRWSLNYQGEMEVALSLRNLADASSRTNDPLINARLTELKAYVHFLKLFYDYKRSASTADYENIISYLSEIHPMRLAHTWALQQYYIKKPKGYVAKAQSARPAAAGQDLYKQVNRYFEDDLRKNNAGYEVLPFKLDAKKAKPLTTAVTAKNISGPNRYEFYVSKRQQLTWKVGNTTAGPFTLLDNSGNIVLKQTIKASATGYSNVTTTLGPGYYSILFGAYVSFGRIEFPKNIAFFSAGTSFYDNASYPLQYLYVPKDATAIVYQDGNGPGTNKRGYWLNPSGKRVDPKKINGAIYRIDVPKEDRGKIWTLNIGHRSYQVMNFGNTFSLSKFEYQE